MKRVVEKICSLGGEQMIVKLPENVKSMAAFSMEL